MLHEWKRQDVEMQPCLRSTEGHLHLEGWKLHLNRVIDQHFVFGLTGCFLLHPFTVISQFLFRVTFITSLASLTIYRLRSEAVFHDTNTSLRGAFVQISGSTNYGHHTPSLPQPQARWQLSCPLLGHFKNPSTSTVHAKHVDSSKYAACRLQILCRPYAHVARRQVETASMLHHKSGDRGRGPTQELRSWSER